MSTEGNKAIVRRLGEVLNAGNLDAVDDILAPDYVRHDPNPLLAEAGPSEYKQAFSRLRRAFPDAHWTLEDLLADGDKVIGRCENLDIRMNWLVGIRLFSDSLFGKVRDMERRVRFGKILKQ